MSHLKSSGDGLPAFENDTDSNPYAYPYFHCNGTCSLVYELVVQFARHWNEISAQGNNNDKATRAQLQRLIKRIQVRCKREPLEASWKDSCGDTALHRLCQVARVPIFHKMTSVVMSYAKMLVDVAEALIAAHPASATRARNNWKETPLHQFCSHCGFPNILNDEIESDVGATDIENMENPMLDLLKLLSQDGASELRNCWGSFPLHDACGLPGWELYSDRDPVWRRSRDTPFLTWMKQQHVVMIQYLVEQNPKAIGLRVEGGQTPLHRAFQSLKCSTDVIKMLLSYPNQDTDSPVLTRSLSALWKHYDGLPLLDAPYSVVYLGILWETTVLVLNKISSRLLNASVSTKDCPLHVVQLAAHLYPQHLLERDEHGCTPLILAIRDTCSEDIIKAVLQENPRAASIADSNGRSPLCWAVETGEYSFHDILYQLFTAEPSAVSTRDSVSDLFPFALAAVNTTSSRTATDREEDQVTTIYELLRIDPSVLTQQQQ